jgi:hypothetical protein
MDPSVVNVDGGALGDFLAELRSFNDDLSTTWIRLDGRWKVASESWKDLKKEQFEGAMEWSVVQHQMQNYLTESSKYVNFLSKLKDILDQYSTT